MKRFLGATTLACILSVSAMAGDIPISGAPAPPPSGAPTSPPSPVDIPSGGYADQISDTALSAILTVLGFLAV